MTFTVAVDAVEPIEVYPGGDCGDWAGEERGHRMCGFL